MRGKKHTAEAKAKISASRRIRWINDGVNDLAVPLDEVKSYIEKGYKLGRISIRDRRWVNDGRGSTKCVTPDDAIRLTYMGWQLGKG